MSGFNEETTSTTFSSFPDEFSDFSEISHSAKNPFLEPSVPESPLKKSSPSPAKLFHNTAEIIMGSKNNRYDVFKNDKSNVIEQEEIVVKKAVDDPFKDFAKAAFSEFKVDKMMTGHEFSNKLSDAKNKSFQPMNVKVNFDSSCDTSSTICCKNCLSPN